MYSMNSKDRRRRGRAARGSEIYARFSRSVFNARDYAVDRGRENAIQRRQAVKINEATRRATQAIRDNSCN